MPKGFRIADAYIGISLNRDQLRDDLARLPVDLDREVNAAGQSTGKKLGKGIGDGADGAGVGRRVGDDIDRELQPRAQRSGRDSGDKLSKGMEQSIIRNSPMIVAATAGALTLGAPAVLAGAGVLFAGIAAAAVHSNAQVQTAFSGMTDLIKTTFTNAAQVAVPAFVDSLHRLGTAFSDLTPQFQQAFAALGGPLESLTTGVINMTRNAMPGLAAAMQAAGPAFQGLADFMGKIGSGLGQMFQIISQHAGAAGTIFSALGSIIQSLLPIIGDFIGAGSELAAQILPPLAAVLHVVASALNAIAPILPGVVAGFLALKAVQAVNGPLASLAQNLAMASYNGTAFAGMAGKASSGVSALRGVLGPLAAATAFVSLQQSLMSQQTEKWAQALAQGGQAAAQARDQIEQTRQFGERFGTGLLGIIGKLTQYGSTMDFAKSAGKGLESQTEQQARAQDELKRATDSVTQAIVDQANQALAAVDSGFAYQRALNSLKSEQSALSDAQKQYGRNSQQAADAQLQLKEGILQAAEAAGKQAADLSGLKQGTAEYSQVVNQQALQELYRLRDTMGPEMAGAINQMIAQLQAGGVNLGNTGARADVLRSQVQNLGATIAGVPNSKYVDIQAPTSAQMQQLNALGYRVQTLPNGLVRVYADTSAAEGALDYTARTRYSAVYQTVVQVGSIRNGVGMAAVGGKVGDVIAGAARGFAAGGKLSGPGGPVDDLIAAVNEQGQPIHVSNREWVINEAASARYGDAKMAAVNAGIARISLPPSVRPVAATAPATDSAAGGGNNYNVTINLAGISSVDQNFPRELAQTIRRQLISLDREQR